MNQLVTATQYIQSTGISDRHFRRLKKEGKIQFVPGTDYVYTKGFELSGMSNEDKLNFMLPKIKVWNELLKNAHNIYKLNNKPTPDTTKIIAQIETEATYLKNNGFDVKGFDKRSLQSKVKTGKINRKAREEKKPIRNKVVENAFPKAMELIYNLSMTRALISVNEVVDRAIYYAKQDEDYWEVAACEKYIYTLRRHIHKSFKASGFKMLHEYVNHYNQFRKKQAYVKGSFTDDIGFMDVISLDDHKFDVAGVKVFNPVTGELEQKQVWSWFVVDMKTLMPLGYAIKATPFNEEDIVKLLMQVFRQYGAPNWRVIMDQGLAAGERVLEFISRLGIAHEVQEAYSPTRKSNNERLYKLVKEESDVYQHDFVGSVHPVEGRHKSKTLSPEETQRSLEMAIDVYDKYVNGYLIDRPRKRAIRELPVELLDNSKRITIRKLYDYYYQNHTPQYLSDVQLRYAYMRYDTKPVTFKNLYLLYKKEMYLPVGDVSLTIHEPQYKYIPAIDPADLNKIDLYACQDITDAITGEFISKGGYVCTLESLATLTADEKKARVGIYNKKRLKALKELAAATRNMYAAGKDIANTAIGAEGMIDVRKAQIRQVESLIKNAVPAREIEIVLDKAAEQNENIDVDEASSDASVEKMNNILIDD